MIVIYFLLHRYKNQDLGFDVSRLPNSNNYFVTFRILILSDTKLDIKNRSVSVIFPLKIIINKDFEKYSPF